MKTKQIKQINAKNMIQDYLDSWDNTDDEDFFSVLRWLHSHGYITTYTTNEISQKLAKLYLDEDGRRYTDGEGNTTHRYNETTGHFEKVSR